MRTHLAAHEHNEDASADVGVHALLARELEQLRLCALFGFGGGVGAASNGTVQASVITLPLDRGIAAPCSADEPPLAAALGGVEVLEGDAERFVGEDWVSASALRV